MTTRPIEKFINIVFIYKKKLASTTEGGLPLRYLYLPDSLQKDFLCIAQTNTSKNIETCGILCGTLVSFFFFLKKTIGLI